jgi:hypothetical protein
VSAAIIFAGPSLPPRRHPDDARLDWREPVRQGDLYRGALERPAIIGVIDGYFESVATVWHKEILWAMQAGIHVYGAASIGALRAAELEIFGMRGIGHIYEDFRDGILEDDDEVAVLHGPEELGYPPVTEAMVNLRATFDNAATAGIIDAALGARLTDIAKGLFYKARSYEAVLQAAATAGFPPAALSRLSTWLPQGRVDRKREDAEAMLAAIRAHLDAGVAPLRVSWRMAETAAWRVAARQDQGVG